ncbi:PREDICTED: protein FAR1-RELATED SEQUENCE 3-like [Camelina sativa]|uniref:Protein FAR1-RELATED SEQUENCE 3-like n=1 Tax=Camelina sativa TaxID=90675 RepID=A0ABM0YWU5_CAMSA|nr:PREDICTED: protein FAR1-RELATED SEQUENCE 3-like [Camelina sativa]
MENSYISEDFSPKEDYDSISVDTVSVSESVEKEDNIANNENYVQTEEVVILEANIESELKDELCIGMEFSSDETAHTTYQKYGGSHGFDVRKQQRTIKKEKVVRLRYVCSKEGYRKETNDEKSYSQPITRCGCNAHMTCYLQKNERYKIVSFEQNHNHDLVMTPMKHLLRGNRALSISQKQHADDAEMSGISAKANVEMMSREVGGRENLGFLAKDYQSYIYRKRMAKMEKGDARALDEDDMITNIFWAYDRSISDYNLFGDVVCFDTTYKTNEYDRPFAPFVGVNHHKQTVVFGAALLYDETIESYKWLFETFLGAMSGKQPKTILTDQCAAMANAIVKVFPETKHRLCVWHIYQNAAKKLSHVFHGAEQFAMDFSKCVYDHEEEQDWLLAWSDMLEKHKLTEDKWLKNLFELKEKWAMEVYTPEVFSLLQRQYIVIGDYVATKVSKSEMVYEYKVSYRGVAREHLVNYDAISQTIHCGCMKFSFAGILCRHALKVLDKKNVRRIPSTYILTRWSKEAKTRRISYYHPKTLNETEKQSIGRRYSHICRTFREIASVAADHIELTLCANEDAIQLLRKLEEKKKELVKANAWMPQSSDVGLVEEEEEVEDKEVPNARGIKRKASVGRPKNQKVGPHGRYLNVLEDTTLTPDTQLSVTTTSPTLHHESFISQVFKEYDKSYGGPS